MSEMEELTASKGGRDDDESLSSDDDDDNSEAGGSILNYLQNRHKSQFGIGGSRNNLPGKQAKRILERLSSNDSKLTKLELNIDIVGCLLSDLIRALCFNTTVKHVSVDSKFLETLSFEKTRIILEILGGLPQLETLSIKFPDTFLNNNNIPTTINGGGGDGGGGATDVGGGPKITVVGGPPNFSSNMSTISSSRSVTSQQSGGMRSTGGGMEGGTGEQSSTTALLSSALLKAPKLRWVEVYNLQLSEPDDDRLLAQAFRNNGKLKKVDLIDLVVAYNFDIITGEKHDDDDDDDDDIAEKIHNDDYLENFSVTSSKAGSRQNHQPKGISFDFVLDALAELPYIEEVEIRMKRKQPLPGLYLFSSLCAVSTTLRSLVLWNMILSLSQLRYICEALCDNTCIKRLEIWCSDLGEDISDTSESSHHNYEDNLPNDSMRSFSTVGSGKGRTRKKNSGSYSREIAASNHFGILLADMLETNKTLETMVMSHVGLYHSGCVALAHALKTNTTLQELALLAVSPHDDDDYSTTAASTASSIHHQLTRSNHNNHNNRVNHNNNDDDASIESTSLLGQRSGEEEYDEEDEEEFTSDRDLISKAVMQMMHNNKGLKSVHITYDELPPDGCLAVSKSLQQNSILGKLNNHEVDVGRLRRKNKSSRRKGNTRSNSGLFRSNSASALFRSWFGDK